MDMHGFQDSSRACREGQRRKFLGVEGSARARAVETEAIVPACEGPNEAMSASASVAQQMSFEQVREKLRAKMRGDMHEAQLTLDKCSKRADAMQESVCRASAPVVETLNGILGHLAAGGDVPQDFTEAWLATLHKDIQAGDSGPRAARAAAATRPLALKNADARAVAGMVALSMRDNPPEKGHLARRGFVPGRAAPRGTQSRSMPTRDDFTTLVFFDVDAAFPPVCRQFLRMATCAVALPGGALWGMEALYAYNNTLRWRGERTSSAGMSLCVGSGPDCPRHAQQSCERDRGWHGGVRTATPQGCPSSRSAALRASRGARLCCARLGRDGASLR